MAHGDNRILKRILYSYHPIPAHAGRPLPHRNASVGGTCQPKYFTLIALLHLPSLLAEPSAHIPPAAAGPDGGFLPPPTEGSWGRGSTRPYGRVLKGRVGTWEDFKLLSSVNSGHK